MEQRFDSGGSSLDQHPFRRLMERGANNLEHGRSKRDGREPHRRMPQRHDPPRPHPRGHSTMQRMGARSIFHFIRPNCRSMEHPMKIPFLLLSALTLTLPFQFLDTNPNRGHVFEHPRIVQWVHAARPHGKHLHVPHQQLRGSGEHMDQRVPIWRRMLPGRWQSSPRMSGERRVFRRRLAAVSNAALGKTNSCGSSTGQTTRSTTTTISHGCPTAMSWSWLGTNPRKSR